ncbi:MAG: right-handed parallel beta-helix repeat-containing protein, partial [bacterium]|nr:right-handed parallel beta-helix repeat-containing protein [bacterium]
IDFEARGDGIIVDNCTFENNAGAGIEVLGLRSPQPVNVTIRNSRFIKNNWANKLGPSEIYVWGKKKDPKVCCSTGTIENNAYVLLPGVNFFVNEAPETTQWTLRNNTPYASAKELEKAVPYNKPPVVEAGDDIITDRPTARLAGSVTDDGRPGKRLVARWEQLEGPGTVTFKDAARPKTTATFSRPGDYILRLVGDDGELWTSDMITVHVVEPGVSVAKAWEFNKNLDKEGWTEVNPGTVQYDVRNAKELVCTSYPVKYVAGGYYIVAVKDSPDAHLLSADNLGVDLADHKTIRIKFMNRTPATRMRFRFVTDADPAWGDAKSQSFDLTPNDNGPREYAVDMSRVPGWTGRLKQLRLDLAPGDGTPLTGTCRIDYIWIDNSFQGGR